jgi:hypothetical protein
VLRIRFGSGSMRAKMTKLTLDPDPDSIEMLDPDQD